MVMFNPKQVQKGVGADPRLFRCGEKVKGRSCMGVVFAVRASRLSEALGVSTYVCSECGAKFAMKGSES